MKQIHTTTLHDSNRESSLREWLEAAKIKYGAEEENLRETLRAEFKENNLIEWPKRFDEMFDLWFRHAHRVPAVPEQKAAHAAERQALIESGMAKIKERDSRIRVEAKVELLSMLMSNGKPLGECTFAEISEMTSTYRSFLERLSKLGRPRQKIKTICTEANLLQLWNTGGANNPHS